MYNLHEIIIKLWLFIFSSLISRRIVFKAPIPKSNEEIFSPLKTALDFGKYWNCLLLNLLCENYLPQACKHSRYQQYSPTDFQSPSVGAELKNFFLWSQLFFSLCFSIVSSVRKVMFAVTASAWLCKLKTCPVSITWLQADFQLW